MPKNICPICRKEYEYALRISIIDGKQVCEHDKGDIGSSKTSRKRHMNEEASIMAMRMAMEQRKIDAEINKEIPVTSYQQGSAGKTEMIPEKVIKSLEEKVAPILEKE